MNREAVSDSNLCVVPCVVPFQPPALPQTPPPLPPQDQRLDYLQPSGEQPLVQLDESPNNADDSEWVLPYDELEIQSISRHGSSKKETASWVTSLFLHATALVLLVLALAPADFAGDGPLSLEVTVIDEPEVLEEVIEEEIKFEMPVVEKLEAIDVFEPQQQAADPPPLDLSNNSAQIDRGDGSQSGDVTDPGNGRTGKEVGPRGSFFGIEADGHTFVYILDMSGSMEGKRYDRASAELIRSINALTQNQNFYVLLFDDSALQMFGEHRARPKPVAATPENKARLSAWLKKAFRGGGTNPCGALHVALRMKASCIFMLSDGDFNRSRSGSGIGVGSSDAFKVVKANNTTPIHTIAFEDTNSCKNMDRLSTMTGGTYRFVASDDGKKALANARTMLASGDTEEAEIILRGVAKNAKNKKAGAEAREELIKLVTDRGSKAITARDHEAVKTVLADLLDIDPQAEMSSEIQLALFTELMDWSKQELTDKDANANPQQPRPAESPTTVLRQLLTKASGSKSVGPIRIEFIAMLSERTLESIPGNLEIARFALLELAALDPQGKISGKDQQTIITELLIRSDLERAKKDPKAAVILPGQQQKGALSSTSILKHLVKDHPGSKMASLINESWAQRVLKKAQDLNALENRLQAIKLLNKAITNYPNTSAAKQSRKLMEQIKDDVLASVEQLQETDGDAAAVERLQEIELNFSNTPVAPQAKKALETLIEDMLCKERDARKRGDRRAAYAVKQSLISIFGKKQFGEKIAAFGKRDQIATKKLKLAKGCELNNRTSRAIELYTEIAIKLPRTIAAEEARKRLDSLNPNWDHSGSQNQPAGSAQLR